MQRDTLSEVASGEVSDAMGGPSQEVISIGRHMRAMLGTFRSLDLGSGSGRNTIYLAGLGAQATAVDSSEDLIQILQSVCRRAGLNVNAVCERVECFPLSGEYDLVVCHGILHHLSLPAALEMISQLKSSTSRGGVHMITVLDNGIGHTSDWLNTYGDWTCLALERYIKRDYHLGIGYDLHWVEKLIFQRPGDIERALTSTSYHLDGSARPDVHQFLMTDPLIQTKKATVIGKLGAPDLSFTYATHGMQLSFRGLVERSHQLELLFWSKHLAYFENDILVGYSEFQTDRFHTFNPLRHGSAI